MQLTLPQVTLLRAAAHVLGTPSTAHRGMTVTWALSRGYVSLYHTDTDAHGNKIKVYTLTSTGRARLGKATLKAEPRNVTKLAIRTAASKARSRLDRLAGGLPAGPVRDEIEAIRDLLD